MAKQASSKSITSSPRPASRPILRGLASSMKSLKRKIATQHGAPLLTKNFELSMPRLYFVGMPAAPTFGPVMRFAVGSRYTADRLSRHLALQG